MGRVITNQPRVEAELVRRFEPFGVADVNEAQGRTGLLAPRLRPIYRPAKVVGTALTCEVPPGDNWMLHVAVEQLRPGDVVVVTPTSECHDGYFGELLATSMRAHGAVGLVIDAGVRDVAELTRMRFAVWSAAISATGTVKQTLGNVQTPIVCAGQRIDPGDLVLADDDGVVVVPRGRVRNVLQAVEARKSSEAEKIAEYAAGSLGLDLNNMRESLAACGLTYENAEASTGEEPR